jgi:hypothetical protein
LPITFASFNEILFHLSRAGLGRASERGTLQTEYGPLLRIGTAGRSGSIDRRRSKSYILEIF